MTIGDYPKEYDASKHGPYDPARYYGKADTPFGQVKLVELPAWFARRNKSPAAFAGLCSRAYWRWQHRFMQPRKVGMAGFYQSLFACMTFFYVINYARITSHKNYKYH
ncbi:putative ATP synthase subunit f, mitochondrial [Plodia interpunctella]|uniref:putative ATP synthase subunit f, mitochondrial n=1 Tax=Plodia interpunctella TaxID=58824 RepID=UPI0023678B18|nr:putative ATP synthase subunit f, mitochondrial [Plodia interpunctella]